MHTLISVFSDFLRGQRGKGKDIRIRNLELSGTDKNLDGNTAFNKRMLDASHSSSIK